LTGKRKRKQVIHIHFTFLLKYAQSHPETHELTASQRTTV